MVNLLLGKITPPSPLMARARAGCPERGGAVQGRSGSWRRSGGLCGAGFGVVNLFLGKITPPSPPMAWRVPGRAVVGRMW